jgi:hypothetical protein
MFGRYSDIAVTSTVQTASKMVFVNRPVFNLNPQLLEGNETAEGTAGISVLKKQVL